MTSKNLYFNLLKEDAKRRLWSIALSFLAFFFTLPVVTALLLGNYNKSGREYIDALRDLTEFLSFRNGWMPVMLILLSLVFGVSSFSYLHSRQKVDFYHGIPVKRSRFFWVNYLNGIFIPAAVYGINLVLMLLVAAVYGYSPFYLLGTALEGYLLFLIHYCMMYSVTVLAMVLTGSIIIGIMGTAVFQFYFPCMLLVLQLCFDQFFYTSYRGGGEIFGKWINKSSPFIFFLYNLRRMNGPTKAGGLEWMVRILTVLAVTAVFTFCSFWLYKKRKMEAAGKAMAFSVSMPIVRLPIVILSSLWGGVFLWMIQSTLGWAIFGLICGAALSHCVLEIIYHYDFRKLFSHSRQLVVSALLAAAFFGGFRYDLFGYDKYIPKENSLESVAIYMSNSAYWVPYGSAQRNQEGGYSWKYQDSEAYILKNMELKDTAPVLNLARKAVAGSDRVNHGSDYQKGEYWQNEYHNFSVKYRLKNGREVYRTYELHSDEAKADIVKIYENPDFLRTVYPILAQSQEETAWVRVSQAGQTLVVSRDRNGTDKAMTEKMLLAYQKDFENLKIETMEQENPIASIQFFTKLQAEAEEKKKDEQNSWHYDDVTSKGYYPIYPSFHRTLELLKECGVDTDAWSGKNVISITIDFSQFGYYDGVPQFFTITDKAEIDAIMAQASDDEFHGMNPFGAYTGETVTFTAENDNGGFKSSASYSVLLKKLPEDVKKEIEQLKKEF